MNLIKEAPTWNQLHKVC